MTGRKRKVYPEHEKCEKVSEFSQEIGEFLEWLGSKGIQLATIHKHSDECLEAEYEDEYDCGYKEGDLMPVGTPKEKLLAEFYEIDLDKLEREKHEMLKTMRDMNKPKEEECQQK